MSTPVGGRFGQDAKAQSQNQVGERGAALPLCRMRPGRRTSGDEQRRACCRGRSVLLECAGLRR